jgi:Domain of unknown function (DUF3883)
MGIKQKADDARKKAYQKVIATKLLDGIEQLSDRPSSKRRWIWELLQNAKDVANKQVRVEIVLTKDYVKFRHNGKPFSIENITYLIEQVSSKERTTEANELPQTTGKFGTGFMTTHLLSRQVEVSSILQNIENESLSYKRFNVLLDRSATNLDEMIQKVDDAFSIFEEIDNDSVYPPLANYQQNQNCDTSFRYVLDNAGLQVAKAGIQDLQNAIAYALAFIPTIQSVTVTDDTKESIYCYQTIDRLSIGKISIVTIERNSTESPCETQTIACLSNENQTITIAVQVEVLGDDLYSIKEITNEIPILFCEFPLIGSESFPYPVVINSHLFNPTEPRDGIFLNPANEQKTPLNKAIIEEATLLYGELLNQVTSDWQNVHLLGKLKSEAKLPDNIDINWYKEKIANQIVAKLSTAPVVDTVSGNRICLSQALILDYKLKRDVQQFAYLTSSLHANRLPKPDHVLDWHDILKSDFGKKFSDEIRYTLEQLLQDIATQQTLEQLATRLCKNNSDTIDWTNQVIAFTNKSSEEFLDRYSVIPNQYNQFKKKKELYKDEAIPEALKDILIILSLDWRTTLAHKQITYQLSNIRDINQAVDDINKLTRINEHSSLRKAVYSLVSCFPSNAKFAQNTKLVLKRDTIWNFARDIDSCVPNKIHLESWIPSLWQEADLWLMQTLVDDIEKLKNVQNLSKQLNVTPKDAISWLDRFIAFLKQEEQSKLYSKKVIFPNQEGLFKEEEDLYIDNKIPDELKDVLEDLGCGCRGKLLDLGIRGFENHRNQFTVKDVSDDIQKRLQDAKNDKDDLAEYWSFSVPIYNLISYFGDLKPNDSNKLAIWAFADRFYPGKIPSRKSLPNLKNFSWNACNKWIFNSIAKDIDNFENLEIFVKYFNSDRNSAIEWLDNFSCFAAEPDDKILNLYAILPNQSGQFRHKKALKKDEDIPEELKVILELLTSDYWNDFLLDRSLKRVEQLFEKDKTKTIQDIATEIDRAIKEWEHNDKTANIKFTKVITGMIEWSNTQPDKKIEKLFSYFYANKAQLLLKTLDDNEVSSGIFKILNHREKLSVLTDLAENPNISEKDLQYFSQNQAQFKDFQELREQISEQEFQDFNVLIREVSLQEIGELVDNKEKLDVLKLLQDSAEAGEMSDLIFALQELGVYEAVANLFRGTRVTSIFRGISKNEEVDVPEKTVYKQDIAAIGREGEEFVYHKLVEKFGENRVNWLNKDSESRSPYDFVIIDNDGEENLYIDAKTTLTEESSADRIPFFVGNSEWEFSENNDRYYLARVFRIRTATPTVKFLKFVRLLDC